MADGPSNPGPAVRSDDLLLEVQQLRSYGRRVPEYRLCVQQVSDIKDKVQAGKRGHAHGGFVYLSLKEGQVLVSPGDMSYVVRTWQTQGLEVVVDWRQVRNEARYVVASEYEMLVDYIEATTRIKT